MAAIGRPAMLGHDRGDGREVFGLLIDARLGGQVGRLKDLVRLVVAKRGIHRADDGQLVHQGRLLRQVLAEAHAGKLRGDRAERPADSDRRIRLHVPRIDMAGAAGHPNQDDALAARQCVAGCRCSSAARSRSANDNPAKPARLALRTLRRLTTERPSCLCGFKNR